MQVTTHTQGFDLTAGLQSHIERKLNFSLSRLELHIRSVVIFLSDINGPRGGIDKQCRVKLTLGTSEEVVIKDTQADLYHAIDNAMRRAKNSIERKVGRMQKRLMKSHKNLPLQSPLLDEE